jgi:hypothetical protein
MLRRWVRARPGSRTLQEDLDLYKACLLLRLKNAGSQRVEEEARRLQQSGRGSWARVAREELGLQMRVLMSAVVSMGGQDAYPMPKKKKQKQEDEKSKSSSSSGGSLLERTLDYKGRDLDIEERPVAHPSEGWRMRVARSGIAHRAAGLGVVVEGFVAAGTLLCVYPGQVWWPGTYAGPPDNEYAIARYDGVVLDALDWDAKARAAALLQHARAQAGVSERAALADERFRNPFALGSFVNHPPPGALPNVMQVPFDFPKDQRFVPHEIASPKRPIYMLDSFLETTPSLLLIASRNLRDEELFLNYRFNPALPYPDWYVQPDLEEATRRWAKHSFLLV